tara:strand:- start:124 stop:1317 length:1194 start_codon:yes stop_codon:yes gene_type:complete
MNYLILAGGTGTRLGSVKLNLPKPMIEISGKPAIKRIVDHILLYDDKAKIFISTFFKDADIRKYFKNNKNIILVKEPRKLGTGGAIKFFLNSFRIKDFCLLNGDTLINFDLGFHNHEWGKIKDKYSINSLVLLKKIHGDCSDYGTYQVRGRKVISFKEKQKSENSLVSTGVYYFKAESLRKLLRKYPNEFSFEEKFLPEYIKNKSLAYSQLSEFDLFFDIGTPSKLKLAQNKFISLSKRPAAFFDRDNTLIHDDGYNSDLENYLVMQDSYFYVKLFQSLGYQVFIVSNQSSINRKINSLFQVNRFIAHLMDDFKSRGAYITDSVFCPHTPEENCNCRKPKTQLVEDLAKKYNLSLEKSIFLGDSNVDENLAKNAGITFYGVKSMINKKAFIKKLDLL